MVTHCLTLSPTVPFCHTCHIWHSVALLQHCQPISETGEQWAGVGIIASVEAVPLRHPPPWTTTPIPCISCPLTPSLTDNLCHPAVLPLIACLRRHTGYCYAITVALGRGLLAGDCHGRRSSQVRYPLPITQNRNAKDKPI